MPSQLLAALPGLHGTVLGIGTAFLSAFFIQAQQKIYEFEDRSEEVRKGMKDFISPAVHFQAGSPDIYDDAGGVDWVKIQALLRSARLMCQKRISGDPYEFENLTDELLLDLCRSLCSTLYRISVSYPFEGHSRISSSQTERGDFSSIDDGERFKALCERVGYLGFCWASAGEGFTALARKASEIEAEQIAAEIEEWVEKTRRARGNDPTWSEQTTREWFTHINSSRQPIDYASMIVGGFQRMNEYGQQYLVLYQNVLEVKKKVRERYHFKELAVLGLLVLSWVAGFGIVVPLVLLEMEPNFRTIPVLTPYFVLILSIIPYLLCGFKAWNWLKSMKL